MRFASLALAALALLLSPAAHAQTMQTPFTITDAHVAEAIGPGETTTVQFVAARACPTGAAVLPAGTMVIDPPTSERQVLTVTGALSVPVEQHTCVPEGTQHIAFSLEVSAPAELPAQLLQEAVRVKARVSQPAPGHTDTTESAISFMVPLEAPAETVARSADHVQESPALAPGLLLAGLGALAARRRHA